MKRITKIKWLKVSLIISIVMICLYAIAQDDPSGYTSWFRLRMWEEGDHPGADSVNQNLIDIDLHLHNRDKRIDSLKSAYMEMFNFPSGTWKRYDSTVFDGDSLKFKTGIIPKLASNNTWTGTNNFSATATDFGDGTVIFDLNLTPGEGVFQIRDNSDPLLIYDDDTQTWDFQYPVSINGVPITSGGGDAYLTNRQTFTKRNVFSDTLKADGLSLIDNARITSNLNVTGDVISDLNFLKGSLTNIGTISTDTLAFITNNTQRMVITKDGKILFLDSIRVSNAIAIFDSAKISVDMSMLSDSSGINWTSGGLSQIYQLPSPANILAFKQNEFDFFTKKGNQILYLDSLNGMTLNYGVYSGNGSGLTTLNATNLSTGTVSDSRLSSNIPRIDTRDSFTKKISIDTLFVGKKIDVTNALLVGFPKRSAVADANYIILSTDRLVSFTSITATRTVTLPKASDCEAGTEITVNDESGSASSAKKIIIVANVTLPDYINGVTADTIITAYGSRTYISNGVGKWTYDAGIARGGKIFSFSKIVTFLVAPIFSTIVAFDYGVITTTLTASSTATFNGDLVPASWTKNQSSLSRDQYEKIKIVRVIAPTVTNISSAPHGITDWHTISGFTVQVASDSSLNMLIQPNMNYAAQTAYTVWYIDSLNVNIKSNSSNVNIPDDTVKFRITYTDYNR